MQDLDDIDLTNGSTDDSSLDSHGDHEVDKMLYNNI